MLTGAHTQQEVLIAGVQGRSVVDQTAGEVGGEVA